jgi:hypothetical protein
VAVCRQTGRRYSALQTGCGAYSCLNGESLTGSRTFLGGMIAFNKCNSTMDCRVRDISSTGARDHLTNTAVIPDQFDLTIARKERSFRFTHGLARRLRQSEAEKTVLRKRIAQLTENGAA